MRVKRLYLNNFKLFIEENIEPKGLNIFIGDNRDNESSNASGKSTLALEALMFVLYGYTTAKLADTISKGKNMASVEVLLELKGIEYKISREIPSKLYMEVNGEEKQFATATIAQKYINAIFGDVDFFKKFRTLDMQSGINLLDLGNTSLKNLLMQFIQDYFTKIRKSLQEKKQNMARFHIKHRIFTHFYSEKRIAVLDKQITRLKGEFGSTKGDPNTQAREIYSELCGSNTAIINIAQHLEEISRNNCPTCNRKLPKEINKKLVDELNEELDIATDRSQELTEQLGKTNKDIGNYNKRLEEVHNDLNHVRELKQKIEHMKILKDYKYTDRDVSIYTSSLRVLDNFSALYIENWLASLSVIINALLKEINISIKFDATKEFMTIQDGTETMKYDQLSTGQKRFLNIIFKLSILMHKNLEGIIVIDEGIDALDITNLKRLIRVFESLPFQVFLISQHSDIKSLKDVKCFNILRQNNKAKVVA